MRISLPQKMEFLPVSWQKGARNSRETKDYVKMRLQDKMRLSHRAKDGQKMTRRVVVLTVHAVLGQDRATIGLPLPFSVRVIDYVHLDSQSLGHICDSLFRTYFNRITC